MYSNILVPITTDHAPTTEAALSAAETLASDGAKITALTVFEMPPPVVASQFPDELLERTKNEVFEALKSYVGDRAEPHVIVGHAARTILDFAQKDNVDCIVVASHKPGLSDYFLGSTANHVVRHAHCAVHVVR